MNKKVIIQIVIIVGAFVGAGSVLYNGLFKNNVSVVTSVVSLGAKENEKILPYGSTLGLDNNLEKRGFQFGLMNYPEVAPSEVGILESALVVPLRPQK